VNESLLNFSNGSVWFIRSVHSHTEQFLHWNTWYQDTFKNRTKRASDEV